MSTVRPKEGYLKILEEEDDPTFLILVYEETDAGYKGMVMRSNDPDYPVGTYCDTWNRRIFKEMADGRD